MQNNMQNLEYDKHLGLRIDVETHGKLKSLAQYEGRSINREVLYLIRQAIMKHEKENGKL
ncbi:MAG: Arc family DNA-binding protein [Lachnospiraceae bacterium]